MAPRAAGEDRANQASSGIVQAPSRLGRTTQNWIGRSRYPADPTSSGRIADSRIYRGAMTVEQVPALATAP